MPRTWRKGNACPFRFRSGRIRWRPTSAFRASHCWEESVSCRTQAFHLPTVVHEAEPRGPHCWTFKEIPMSTLNRRTFLKNSLWFTGVTASADLLERSVRAAPLGANERIRVAVMGVHGRGRNHVANFLAQKDAEVACLCEVDNNVVG